MAIVNAFDRYLHFRELRDPLDTAEGVLSPATRRARCQAELGVAISATQGNARLVQSAPAAKTTSTTLTAAELIGGLITSNQGAGAAAAYTLPTAAAMDTALPGFAANDAFDFAVINISVVAAEDVTMTTNTGWTLVGLMKVDSNDADSSPSSGLFRARKTGTGAWTLYRLA